MKQKKRKIQMAATVSAFLLIAGLLSGCGGKVTAEEILKEAVEKSEKISSFTGDMDMEMTIGAKKDGVSMDIETGLNMDIEATKKPNEYHMKGNLSMGFMNLNMDMEIYQKENKEGTKITTYTYADDEWTKSVDKKDESEGIMLDLSGYVGGGYQLTLDEEAEDDKTYVVRTSVSGDKFEETDEIMGGMLGSSLEEIDLAKLKADVMIKIYKESGLPASFVMEVKEGLGEDSVFESQGATMTLERLKCSINFKEYDSITKIKLPKDALDAKEAEPDSTEDVLDNMAGEGEEDDSEYYDDIRTDGDGNLIITDYGHKKEVIITPPEGMKQDSYSNGYSVSYSVDNEDDDSYNSLNVSYLLEQLDDYFTEEDLISSFKESTDYYTEEAGYSDVVYTDPKTIQVGEREAKYIGVTFRFLDKIYEGKYMAWVLTEDGFAVRCNIDESSMEKPGDLVDEKRIADFISGIGSD